MVGFQEIAQFPEQLMQTRGVFLLMCYNAIETTEDEFLVIRPEKSANNLS